MPDLSDLSPDYRAALRIMPTAELEAELECTATRVAELELRLMPDPIVAEAQALFGGHLLYQDDPLTLTCYLNDSEQRASILHQELTRRQSLRRPLSGPLYDRQTITEIKDRIDLPEFIASMHAGTQLKRSGGHMVGLCPYHAENTGSLHVWADHYHCFGCGEHGDVIDWLLKMQCSSWKEAVEYAARYAGVVLSAPTDTSTTHSLWEAGYTR
jgi:hypothetical protein